jgi:polysaccharide biosynthesis protein PelD
MISLFKKFDKSLLEKVEITKWIETIVISILFPIIGYTIDSLDPLFINYQFPWLILAPLLISLRYGLACGLVSASLLISMVAAGYFFGWWEVPFFPEEMIVGLMLITLISAEFNVIGMRKIKLLENKYNYVNARMDKFTRDYHLLKGSHHLLEQQIASQAKSLRSFLLDLERQIFSLEKHEGEPLAGIGTSILNLFSDVASVQVAAIYAVTDDEQKKIKPKPVALFRAPTSFVGFRSLSKKNSENWIRYKY